MSKICKKRVHWNDKKNLPWDFKKCPISKYIYTGADLAFLIRGGGPNAKNFPVRSKATLGQKY